MISPRALLRSLRSLRAARGGAHAGRRITALNALPATRKCAVFSCQECAVFSCH